MGQPRNAASLRRNHPRYVRSSERVCQLTRETLLVRRPSGRHRRLRHKPVHHAGRALRKKNRVVILTAWVAQVSACVQFQVTELPKFHCLMRVRRDRAVPFTDRK